MVCMEFRGSTWLRSGVVQYGRMPGSGNYMHRWRTLSAAGRDSAAIKIFCWVITRMKLRVPKHPKPGQIAAATPEELREFSEGLICIAPGTRAEEAAGIFGRHNVYVELQRHGQREEEAWNEVAIEAARRLKLPLVATNGVCYAQPAQREVLDVFTCLYHKTTLENAGRLLSGNAERYLKPAADMNRLFADLPEAIANTQEISSRLKYEMKDLGYKFPPYPVPAEETMDSFLRKRTEEGARLRLKKYTQKHREQIDHELKLIQKLELAGYFLIVWDIMEFCRREGHSGARPRFGSQ